MALNFDSNRAHELLIQWKLDSVCNDELITMYYALLDSLLSKTSYKNYPDHIKDDMVSEAVYQFLKYSHNYNPDKIKSKNGAFTFLAWNSECSFKKAIKRYYREKYMDDLIADNVDVFDYYDRYSYNMINQLDSDTDVNERLDNWSHDELDS